MKSNLFLILFFCCIIASLSAFAGGWKKGSFRENDAGLDNAFRKAFEVYQKENPSSNIDYTQRLTIYRQQVNGINYKMCFIDLKSNLNVVQEYTVTSSPFGQNGREPNFRFYEKNTFNVKSENIKAIDDRYPRIYNTLFGFLKNSGENILFIKKIEMVQASFDNFYIVTAQGEKKEHIYVAGQSRDNIDEYEGYGILQ